MDELIEKSKNINRHNIIKIRLIFDEDDNKYIEVEYYLINRWIKIINVKYSLKETIKFTNEELENIIYYGTWQNK